MALNERPVPEAAQRDPDAVEMIRVWIAEKGLHCSMKVGMYQEGTPNSEEKAWGRILADVARHVGNALQGGYGRDSRVSVDLIVQAMNDELAQDPKNIRGSFIQRH